MRIWHSRAETNFNAVNGVNAVVWLVAREQAAEGHDVTVLIDGVPDSATGAFARNHGIRILSMPTSLKGYAAAAIAHTGELRPDVVHMHSVFVPSQSVLAWVLNRVGIPYIVTAHGGVAPSVLRRNRLRKSIYSWFAEKRRFANAAYLTAVAPGEEAEIRSFVPSYRGPVVWIPNPVDPPSVGTPEWRWREGVPRVVFLGRFDVQHKGLDILFDIAGLLPRVDFHLFGQEDARTRSLLEALRERRLPNVHFSDPVFGAAKVEALSGANLYIQTSRWEGFPISIMEAMYMGLPCAINSRLHLAQLFEDNDMGIVIPEDTQGACDTLRDHLGNPYRLLELSAKARDFARRHFCPGEVAQRFVECYEHSVAR